MIWLTNIPADRRDRKYGYVYPVPYMAGFDPDEPWPWVGFTDENLFRFGFIVGPPKATDHYDVEQLLYRFDGEPWIVGLYELERGEIVNAMVPASTQSIAVPQREPWCCWCGDPECNGLGPGEVSP